MVYISQLYTANSYFIRETAVAGANDADLNDLFGAISKKDFLNNAELSQATTLLESKLKNFDRNVDEIASFSISLRKSAVKAYISRAEFGTYNEDYDKFFSNPQEDILFFKDDFPKLLENNSTIDSYLKDSLLEKWNGFAEDYKRPNRKQLVQLEKDCNVLIKNKISELVEKSIISNRINFSYLPKEIQRLVKTNSEDFFAKNNWQPYLQTFSFLIADPSAEKTAHTVFLYINSNMKYRFNEYNDLAFYSIANKVGDCTEFSSIYYESLLHSDARNIKVFYIKENNTNQGHSIICFEYQGLFYIADQTGVFKGTNFNQLIQNTFPEITAIAEVNPKYHQDVLSAPEGYFKNLEYQNIDQFSYGIKLYKQK